MATVTVRGLGKAFKIYPSSVDRFIEWIVPRSRPRHRLHWVLQDVSFCIASGQAVGLIGVNGAGKSTLLKIIAGTMHQTCGQLEVNGRVSALLELGMGFHPDFSGRENAIMGCRLQGLEAAEINRLLPAIVDFAEIGDYIDQPLRTYSSGMHMRLAFSVATAIRPDILIVDEALSVGDAYFQHKSFDRIREFRRQGTTLLLVSHSPASVQAICDHAILLDNGSMLRQGRPDEVLDFYNALLADRTQALIDLQPRSDGSTRTVSGTRQAVVESAALLNIEGEQVELLKVAQPVVLSILVRAHSALDSLVLGFMIKDHLGQAIYGINTFRLKAVQSNVMAGELLDYCFRFPANLGPGSYSVSLALSRWDSHLDGNFEWTDRALLFHVANTSKEDFVGCAWLGATVNVRRMIESESVAPSRTGTQ